MATQSKPQSLIDRVQAAQNQHDLAAFVACFAPDYQSEQPVHPDRAFHGNEQVRKNWSAIFSRVPDFRSELLRSAVVGEAVWSEWHWSGTQADGRPFAMRGVTIFGVQDDQIIWGRLYMEPVEATNES